MNTVTIGFQREDGDFQVLATLNNKDNLLTDEAFKTLVDDVASNLCSALMCQIDVLEREDTPDTVTLFNDDGEAVNTRGEVL